MSIRIYADHTWENEISVFDESPLRTLRVDLVVGVRRINNAYSRLQALTIQSLIGYFTRGGWERIYRLFLGRPGVAFSQAHKTPLRGEFHFRSVRETVKHLGARCLR
jgi:hypothetical protein